MPKISPTITRIATTTIIGPLRPDFFSGGVFRLDPTKEKALVEHLKKAELYASAPPKDGVFSPPIDYPPHERCVEIGVDLGSGSASAIIIGGDLTHEYVSENADYRS